MSDVSHYWASRLRRTVQDPSLRDLSDEIDLGQDLPESECGNFARIFEGTHRSLGKVAVKVLYRRDLDDIGTLEKDIARELKVWRALKHENILPFEGYYIYEGYPSLVSIWIADGSLWGFIRSRRLGRMEALSMIDGISSGLAFMHRSKFIHGDVKSDNVLVSPDRKPLLTDFGWARTGNLSAGYSTASFATSTPWQARELFMGETPTNATDVWAFGMTVYELLANDRPYHTVNQKSLEDYIRGGGLPDKPSAQEVGRSNSEIEQYMWSLCCRCWFWDPRSRLVMDSIEKEAHEKYVQLLGFAGGLESEGKSASVSQVTDDSGRLVGASDTDWGELLHDLQIIDLTGHISFPLKSNIAQSKEVLQASPDSIYSKPMFRAHGGFGEIFQGEYVSRDGARERPMKVAVKRFRDRVGAKLEKHLIHELRVWSQLRSRHPNILPLLGCAFFEVFAWSYPAMVSEWVGDYNLRFSLSDLKRRTALSVALGIAEGLHFLHSNDIIHGDLKSDNILLTVEKNPLIIDFGMSRSELINFDGKAMVGEGTKRWMAPELFPMYSEEPDSDRVPALVRPAGKCSYKSDAWAFGMVVYELLSRQVPYVEKTHEFTLRTWITKGNLPKLPICLEEHPGPERKLEEFFWHICSCCWDFEPERRLAIRELVDKLEVFNSAKDVTETKPSITELESRPRPSTAEMFFTILSGKIPDLTDKLILVSKVHDASSEVYRAEISQNRFEVAVKRFPIQIPDEGTLRVFANEFTNWSKLENPNIMPISGYCVMGGAPAIVTKWTENRSLKDCLGQFDEEETLQLASGIARGLAYVHSQGLVHSDVKSGNILISSNKRPLLTDFGTCRMFTTLNTEATGKTIIESIRWHAFELLNAAGSIFTKETDVWAFGMTVYEILSHKLPYYDISSEELVGTTIALGVLPTLHPQGGEIDTTTSTDSDAETKQREFLWGLCKECWQSDPSRRPSMNTLSDEITRFDSSISSEFQSIINNIVVEPEWELRSIPSELAPRLSSAELLANVLGTREHLNLTNKVMVEPLAKPIRRKHDSGSTNVYQGVVTESQEKVAVKQLRLNISSDEKIAKTIAKEIRIWSEMKHDNILPLLGYIIEGDYPSLISTWIEKGSLREYLPNLSRKDLMKMALGIASGLAYIHTKRTIHSDLRCDNVLVSPSNTALITDFGGSRMDAFTAEYSPGVKRGSTRWHAIEYFYIPDDDSPSPIHTTMTDVWAFGMTVYELLARDIPYHHIKDTNQVMLCISRGRLPTKPRLASDPIGKRIDEYFWSICERCWKDPELRPSMAELEMELSTFSRAE